MESQGIELEHTRRMLDESERAREDLKASLKEAADRTKEKTESMKIEYEELLAQNKQYTKTNTELHTKITEVVEENAVLKERLNVLNLENTQMKTDISELKEGQKDAEKLEKILQEFQNQRTQLETSYKTVCTSIKVRV